jgi:hypothetical protein
MKLTKEEVVKMATEASTELYRNTVGSSLEYKQALQIKRLCEDWLEFDNEKE